MFGLDEISRMNKYRDTKPFKAKAAKAAAVKMSKGAEDIKHLLSYCYGTIKSASELGGRRVENILRLRTPVSEDQRRRVFEQLVKDGYTVHADGSVSW